MPDDLMRLAESVELEKLADLEAVTGNFGAASMLMKRVNAIRRQFFGRAEPTALRDLTVAALRAKEQK